MEKRLGSRMHVGVDGIIDCRPAGLCRCIIHNSSISGLYVELAEQRLSVNARADIVFFLNVGGITHLRRVRTHVIRSDAGGYGLMLNEISADAVALQNQLCDKIFGAVPSRGSPAVQGVRAMPGETAGTEFPDRVLLQRPGFTRQ